MAENTSDTQDQATTTQDQAPVQATEAAEEQRKLYATKAEAEAAKPADAAKSLKPFEVLHNGTSKGWVLARGYDNALSIIARIDGYTVSTGQTKEVTKETVVAKLATFSDDELKALGLTRKKGR
jgi:hypothetical protein